MITLLADFVIQFFPQRFSICHRLQKLCLQTLTTAEDPYMLFGIRHTLSMNCNWTPRMTEGKQLIMKATALLIIMFFMD